VSNHAYVTASFPEGGTVFEVVSDIAAGDVVALDSRTPFSGLAPNEGATFGPDSELSWDARAQGPSIVRVRDAASNLVLRVVTSRSRVAWPAGHPLLPGTYTWRVSHHHRLATVDDIAIGQRRFEAFVVSPLRTFVVPQP
jgi:hypothetical protein